MIVEVLLQWVPLVVDCFLLSKDGGMLLLLVKCYYCQKMFLIGIFFHLESFGNYFLVSGMCQQLRGRCQMNQLNLAKMNRLNIVYFIRIQEKYLTEFCRISRIRICYLAKLAEFKITIISEEI